MIKNLSFSNSPNILNKNLTIKFESSKLLLEFTIPKIGIKIDKLK